MISITPSAQMISPTMSAGPPPRMNPITDAMIPSRMASSEIGRPPNGLSGRSPSRPSTRPPRLTSLAVCAWRSARASRRVEATARGVLARVRRLRDLVDFR